MKASLSDHAYYAKCLAEVLGIQARSHVSQIAQSKQSRSKKKKKSEIEKEKKTENKRN